MKIAELFYSIQGESSYAGYPCFFIRLAECNLRCTYCDTRYAYEEDHPQYSIDQILTEINRYPGALVEVTGGEPLLQQGVYPLMNELLATGRKVLLETNGSISIGAVPDEVVKIVDIKCPESGMHLHMNFENFSFLSGKDEIKFVISSRDDYDWAEQVLSDYALQDLATVTFSPVISELSPANLAGWILEDHLPVRLRLQLHTIIWPGKTRGY
ncbi:MAG: radical SAM protein [Deltaproteobacteria bacterium]|nr:radical SAM protein [Deltaproteobacteria bacterium]